MNPLGTLGNVLGHARIRQFERLVPEQGAVARRAHALADAVAFTSHERCQDPDDELRGARGIGQRGARERLRSVGAPGHARQPAAGLRHGIEHGALGDGPAGTEAAGDGVDQSRIQALQVLVAEPEPVQRVLAVVRQEHVCLRDQPAQDLAAEFALGVQGHQPLAAVVRHELRRRDGLGQGLSVAEVMSVLLSDRGLDLDHLGAVLGQVHARGRALDRDPQFDDLDAAER